jgi:trk system potassium uptake protein TrkA
LFQFDQTDRGPKSVVIMGCGGVGSTIAAALAEQGHTVHILDVSAEAFRQLPSSAVDSGQIVTIVADGTLEKSLRRTPIEDSDLFVAVSGLDNRNAMAAQMARQLHGVGNVVCRIDEPVKNQMYRDLGLGAVSATSLLSASVIQAARGQ